MWDGEQVGGGLAAVGGAGQVTTEQMAGEEVYGMEAGGCAVHCALGCPAHSR